MLKLSPFVLVLLVIIDAHDVNTQVLYLWRASPFRMSLIFSEVQHSLHCRLVGF
jgi:hypothetical protein